MGVCCFCCSFSSSRYLDLHTCPFLVPTREKGKEGELNANVFSKHSTAEESRIETVDEEQELCDCEHT